MTDPMPFDRQVPARATTADPLPADELEPAGPVSPDCRVGKCRACAGLAWDMAADDTVLCACTCH